MGEAHRYAETTLTTTCAGEEFTAKGKVVLSEGWKSIEYKLLGDLLGKKKEEALKMGETFLKMIKGTATEEEIESLEEASALEDIAHMPARVKCAVLGWHTMEEMLKCDKCSGHGECSHCNPEG